MRQTELYIVRGSRERAITGLPLGFHYPGELGVGVAVTAMYSRRGWEVIGARPVVNATLEFESPRDDDEYMGYAAVAVWGLAMDGGSPCGWVALGSPVDMLGRPRVPGASEGGLPDAAGLAQAVTEAVIRVYHRRREWAPSWLRSEDWKKFEQVFNLKIEDSNSNQTDESGDPVA